jgi:hypothetical protein
MPEENNVLFSIKVNSFFTYTAVYLTLIFHNRIKNYSSGFYYDLVHSIFFGTYVWAQKARVFVSGKPFQPSVM